MASVTVASLSGGRDNNFNLLRFIAATMVIWSHSFPLLSTRVSSDPLENILGFGLAGIAVNIFFAISGFLIVRSYLTHDSLKLFVQSRGLRIMPALIVAVIFCAFIVGPIFTQLPLEQYFNHDSVWRFIRSNITLYHRYPTLPAVFIDNPRLGVNGSLWTLPYEVFMYGVVGLLGIIGLLKSNKGLILICVLYIVYYLIAFVFPEQAKEWLTHNTPKYLRLSSYFFLGGCFYIFRNRLPLTISLAASLWLLPVLAFKTPLFNLMFCVALVYSTFWLAFVPKGPMLGFNRFDDYSYGVYIYAFPVQQMLVASIVDLTEVRLFFYAFIVTIVLAWLSCKCVEKPALRLNKRLIKKYYAQKTSVK